METLTNFINGRFLTAKSLRKIPNYSPATGKICAELPDSDAEDIDLAVAAATKAFPSWSQTNFKDRSLLLRKIGDLILENLEELARAECLDTGKPLTLARTVDIPRSALNFHFFADAITQFSDEAFKGGDESINYTTHNPLGVVALISPWNLPLYLLTWKIAPALAAGNCVVAKPSEMSPMTASILARIVQAAGLPPGVLNIVHGRGNTAGEALVNHPLIRAISFTGGTKTGIHIATKAAPFLKKVSLELGGKNPNIIFNDCNFETMIETTLRSSFSNQGQICLAGSRILIENGSGFYDRFKEAFIKRTLELRLGNPLDPQTQVGALISKQHMEKVLAYFPLAKKEGGKILCGGEQVKLPGELNEGWYVSPTIIDGLDPESFLNQEEIFGPVVTLLPFKDEDDAVEMANNSPYGLSASLWTSNLSRAHRMSEKLQCGMVWVNCWMQRDLRTPFGGMKQSGLGREGGRESLRFFTEPKNTCIKYNI